MYKGKKVSVIIAAAGSARRMRGIDKIFMDLGDRPVLAQVVKNFEEDPHVDEIVIAVRDDQVRRCRKEIVEQYHYGKVAGILPGGGERPDSVRQALQAVSEDAGLVLVQDGARPFSDREMTARVLEAACESGAAVPAVAVKDTIKVVNEEDGREVVRETPDRSCLRAVQTPQAFDAGLLRKAYGAFPAGREAVPAVSLDGVTDDASLAEAMGRKVIVVEGSEDNIKITTAEDVEKAQMIMERRNAGEKKSGPERILPPFPAQRTGIGFDVHAFAEDRKLILGGVEIPYERGLAGHSDADVLIHAIMDALLGACALRDIGFYFPDTDPAYKGADSMKLLSRVAELLSEEGWTVVNVDSVIMAQEPKLAPHIETMKENIARALGIPEGAVGVNATTTERLGFTGRKEGIAAQAVASVLQGESRCVQ